METVARRINKVKLYKDVVEKYYDSDFNESAVFDAIGKMDSASKQHRNNLKRYFREFLIANEDAKTDDYRSKLHALSGARTFKTDTPLIEEEDDGINHENPPPVVYAPKPKPKQVIEKTEFMRKVEDNAELIVNHLIVDNDEKKDDQTTYSTALIQPSNDLKPVEEKPLKIDINELTDISVSVIEAGAGLVENGVNHFSNYGYVTGFHDRILNRHDEFKGLLNKKYKSYDELMNKAGKLNTFIATVTDPLGLIAIKCAYDFWLSFEVVKQEYIDALNEN